MSVARFLSEAQAGYLLDEANATLQRSKSRLSNVQDAAAFQVLEGLCTTVEILSALVERSLTEHSAREMVEAA